MSNQSKYVVHNSFINLLGLFGANKKKKRSIRVGTAWPDMITWFKSGRSYWEKHKPNSKQTDFIVSTRNWYNFTIWRENMLFFKLKKSKLLSKLTCTKSIRSLNRSIRPGLFSVSKIYWGQSSNPKHTLRECSIIKHGASHGYQHCHDLLHETA